MSRGVPVIAILTPNELMGIGLRSMLEKMFPFAAFSVMSDFGRIAESTPEELFHIFTTANYVVEHRDFFEERRHKCIVLTNGTPLANLLDGYPQINISMSQEQITEQLKSLHTTAHGAPTQQSSAAKDILSTREIEVLKLLVEGHTNKEVAQMLNVATTTVISHRKNICEKLDIRSVAGLTIYAVMKRYIEI